MPCEPRFAAADGAPRLLASIHDVSPRFASQIDRLADMFQARLDSMRFAMLVVPDFWGEAPLRADPAFQAKLRAWAAAGVEMFVHGWTHRDDSRHVGVQRFKAERMTAGEGEFLGLSASECVRRMTDGRKLIEDICGWPVAGFIAPAWLYSDGAHEALRSCGFARAEDHWRVWNPVTGRTLARGPVVTWASRSRARRASSYAVAAAARLCLHAQPVVRIAVHPGDTAWQPILTSIDRTLASFASRRAAGSYGQLAEGGA